MKSKARADADLICNVLPVANASTSTAFSSAAIILLIAQKDSKVNCVLCFQKLQ